MFGIAKLAIIIENLCGRPAFYAIFDAPGPRQPHAGEGFSSFL
ncbi:hypothetical protein HMPREF9136_1166 [Prevotella dentalis DSM 3688]|uniref:Uncharacterized protein n=1 Tax=Prevotella dentalis (strain ATCC 49559 / DSM 3688 / JCM 13448 / NCTC 12043 / ES 2772) TaxID=908937 RepID=F9D2T8_PREDD|nr:hypothetical protein HMPREF9136_1166 [Prevotella dentalis DSM 3688]